MTIQETILTCGAVMNSVKARAILTALAHQEPLSAHARHDVDEIIEWLGKLSAGLSTTIAITNTTWSIQHV